MRVLKTGVTECNRDRTTPGLTLFATIHGHAARLIDMTGKVVQEWAEQVVDPDSGNRIDGDRRIVHV